MKYLKLGFIFAATIFVFAWISFPQEKFKTQTSDYEKYLSPKCLDQEVNQLDQQFSFWNKKLVDAPTNQVYQQKIASLSAAKFKLSGEIKYLHQSDSLYTELNQRFPNHVGFLQALTANAISRHSFREAEAFIAKAYETGEKKFISTLLMTDVYLERGNFVEASANLDRIYSKSHFDYYIRQVKMSDQSGDLDQAILYMEDALALALASKDNSLINWSLSNLGDLYGHQGEIAKSYHTFLKALDRNPADLHSLKGIAWITYSYEKNIPEAKRILHFLKENHPSPDYNLLLAEIAAFEAEADLEKVYVNEFIQEASQAKYGKMYNSYLCEIYGERKGQIAEVMALAKAEVEERPHPVSYSLKAWALHLNNENAKALKIINQYVVGQTSEPNALFRIGAIYHANGKLNEAQKYLSEAKEAEFELGPIAALKIDTYLNNSRN